MAVSRAVRRVLLGVGVAAFVAGAVYLWRTGAVTPTTVRDWLESLGPAAPLLFVAAMICGAFVGLPGMAFVVGGRLAFGPALGFVVGFGGGLLAVSVPFLVARRLRGAGSGTPWRPKHPWLARTFAMIETHPIRTVVVLRLILWFNPPLSYTLAFVPISFMQYLAACAMALAPVVAIAMIATGWFL